MDEFRRVCVYRQTEEGDRVTCRIQSLPSLYPTTPAVCIRCPIPDYPCIHLKARVLVGEDSAGKPSVTIIQASCLVRGIKVDTRSFVQCEDCDLYESAELGQVKASKTGLVDSLTGLYRRDFFDRELPRQIGLALRMNTPLALILLDLDHFKRINDEHGHQQGDQILRTVGGLLKREITHKGMAFRYGGEELAVILPNFSEAEARALAERLRSVVEQSVIPKLDADARNFSITVSIGVSLFPRNATDSPSLVGQADKALYRAKEEGRNRVSVFDETRDLDQNVIDVEVDFVGNADITNNSRVRLEEYYPYPSNPQKFRALKVFDFQRGVYSIGEKDPLIGKPPIKVPLEGKVVEVSKGAVRTLFIIKVSEDSFKRVIKKGKPKK